MSRVNWNTVASRATKAAKGKVNIAEAKDVLNDLAVHLVENYTPGEIIDAIIRLARLPA